MIELANNIKEAYDKSTTQIDKIRLDNQEYRITNVQYSDDCYDEGNIFGTAIARTLEFEIENSVDLEEKEFEYLAGIYVNHEIKWISLGKFITQDVEPNDTINTTKVIAMDYMLKSNISYITNLNYSSGEVTLLQVAQEACSNAGFSLATTNFSNYNFIVDSNQFDGSTLIRQVIQAIAQISGTIAKIKNDNRLYFINPNQKVNVDKIFTLNNYKEAQIKRATHPINLVSLGMTDIEGENVVLRDETSILANGENALVINDNPFAYTEEKRRQLITALFNAVKGFEYKSYSFACQSLFYLETLDKIQFKDKANNTYDSYVFRFNYKSPNGLESEIEAPSITDATVKYQNVLGVEEKIKRTEYLIDKENQRITQLASRTTENEERLAQQQLSIDGISTTVSSTTTKVTEIEGNVDNIEDKINTKRTQSGTNITLETEPADNQKLIDFVVDGRSEQATRSGKNKFNVEEFIRLVKQYDTSATEVTVEGRRCIKFVNSRLYCKDFSTVFNNIKENTRYTWGMDVKWDGSETATSNESLYFGFIMSDEDYSITNVANSYNNITRCNQAIRTQAQEFVHRKITSPNGYTLGQIGFSYGLSTYWLIDLDSIQLEEGIEETNHEPYGVMPSPEFPSPIESIGDDGSLVIEQRGKNLIGEFELGTIDATSGELIENNDTIRTKNFISLSSTKYVFSRTLTNNGKFRVYDKNYDYVGTTIGGVALGNGTLRIFTPNENEKYLKIVFDSATDLNYVAQLEVGEVATDYEEYKQTDYTFYLSEPLRSLPNGVRDTLEEDGIHRRVGIVVLDGSEDENWATSESGTENFYYRYRNISDYKYLGNQTNWLCDRFKYAPIGNNTTVEGMYIINTADVRIRFGTQISITDLRNWLSNNSLFIQYELAEEVIEPYDEYNQGIMDELKMYSWIKHISNSEDANMEISYYKLTDDLDPRFNELQDGLAVTNTKVSKVEQDVDVIKQTVERVEYLTRVKEGTGTVILENCKNGNILALSIVGNIELIYPSENLFPSNNLYLKDTYLLIQSTVNGESVTNRVHLPISELLYYDSTTYDEFIVEYNKAKIIHRVELDTNGNEFILQETYEEDLGELIIELQDGENILTLESFSNCRIKAKYLEKTELTDALASKVEMHSEINQTAGKIESSVNQKLTNYAKNTDLENEVVELSSKITQTATEINSEVIKKVGNDEIISKINQSAEAVGINANKIELSANDVLNLLAGNTINLSGKNIKISSNNFNVDENGNMTCSNATINGGSINFENSTRANPKIIMSGNASMSNEELLAILRAYAGGLQCEKINGGSLWSIGTYSLDSNGNNQSNIALYNENTRSVVYITPGLQMYIRDANENYSEVTPTYMLSKAFNQQSDKKLKKNIKRLSNSKEKYLDKIKKADICSYDFKNKNEKNNLGFVIDTEKNEYNVPEELIRETKTKVFNEEGNIVEEKDIKSIDLYAMVSMLWKAVQEQQEIIEELQNKGGKE